MVQLTLSAIYQGQRQDHLIGLCNLMLRMLRMLRVLQMLQMMN